MYKSLWYTLIVLKTPSKIYKILTVCSGQQGRKRAHYKTHINTFNKYIIKNETRSSVNKKHLLNKLVGELNSLVCFLL